MFYISKGYTLIRYRRHIYYFLKNSQDTTTLHHPAVEICK